jgi:hypothetical protein
MNKLVLFASMMFGIASTSFAMEGPKVEYSADSNMETEQVTMKGHVNYAPGKERREMDMGGKKQIIITRQDKKKVWMLMSEQKMYMEHALGSGDHARSADLFGAKVETTEVGSETINGVNTKKLKVVVTTDKGKMGGFFWKTSDGILVKSDLIAMDKGSKMRMKTELTNLKIGHQDPALFEIPSGYAVMDMGAMMGGAMMGRHNRQ